MARRGMLVIFAYVWIALLAAAAAAQAPGAPPTPIAFEKAVLQAANDLFSKADVSAAAEPVQFVIDPLIDGETGAQSNATQLEARLIADLVKSSYPRFKLATFNATTVRQSPFVLIGTLTLLNNAGLADGKRDAYRVWLTLLDLKSNRVVAKSQARALPDRVDPLPTAFFRDSPVFSKDPATEAYIRTCHTTRVGDPIPDVYADRILVASLISEAAAAYDFRRYQAALEFYEDATRLPGGDQLRVHNGLYLANHKLGKAAAAVEAFGKVVDFGLQREALAIKFLFRPGTVRFVTDARTSGPYPMWLKQVAARTARAGRCLDVVGHTSATGTVELNDRLSRLRAEHIKDRLQREVPALAQKLRANGVGSRQMIVGSGRDDASDALDRRVEFRVAECGA